MRDDGRNCFASDIAVLSRPAETSPDGPAAGSQLSSLATEEEAQPFSFFAKHCLHPQLSVNLLCFFMTEMN